MAETPLPHSWLHLNLPKLIWPVAGFLGAAALKHYQAQGFFPNVPEWTYDIALILAFAGLAYWLWTQDDAQKFLRWLYNRNKKMLLLLLIIIGALVGSCVGLFGYWAIERDGVRTTKTSSDAKRKGDYELIGHIDNIVFAPLPSNPQTLVVIIIASVRNVGAPSIAGGWNLQLTMPGRETVTGENTLIDPTNPIVIHRPSGIPTVYAPEDALYLKASSTPIPTGGQVVGVLMVRFPNITHAAAYTKGTTVKLTFKDVQGNDYDASYEIKGEPDTEPKYYPGMKIVEPPKQGRPPKSTSKK